MKKQSLFTRFPQLQTIPQEQFPEHIFIIPDGNGRWARQHKTFVWEGHRRGAEVIKVLLKDITEIPAIKIFTVWGFSSDNWKREQQEVTQLMRIFTRGITETITQIKKNNQRFLHLGRQDRLPENLLRIIRSAEQDTVENTGQIVCLAIDFGGEDQDMRLLEKGKMIEKHTTITAELLWKLRDGHGEIPPADLLIRTSGELRISDVGWLNGAPTELYFTPKLFPDIAVSDIVDAIIDFTKRERRMGGRK